MEIRLENNPGMATSTINLLYDTEKVEVAADEFGEYQYTSDYFSDGRKAGNNIVEEGCFVLAGATTKPPTAGSLLRITFQAKENLADGTALSFTVHPRGEFSTLSEDKFIPLEGTVQTVVNNHEHVYNEPTWKWSEDYSSITASFFCESGDGEQNVEADITGRVMNPTAETEGKVVFTATAVFQEKTYTDSREIRLVKETIRGDVDGDDKVTANDALKILQHVAKLINLNP